MKTNKKEVKIMSKLSSSNKAFKEMLKDFDYKAEYVDYNATLFSGEVVKIKVKTCLTFGERLSFINDFVSTKYDNSGVRKFTDREAICACVIKYYTDISTVRTKKNGEVEALITDEEIYQFSLSDFYKDILEIINDFDSLLSEVREIEVEYKADILERRSAEIDQVVSQVTSLVNMFDQVGSTWQNMDSNMLNKALENISNVDTKDLVKTVVDSNKDE